MYYINLTNVIMPLNMLQNQNAVVLDTWMYYVHDKCMYVYTSANECRWHTGSNFLFMFYNMAVL